MIFASATQFLAFGFLRAFHGLRRMRAMPRWGIREVASTGRAAANEPLAAFLPRRDVLVPRLGANTRAVLTKRPAGRIPRAGCAVRWRSPRPPLRGRAR